MSHPILDENLSYTILEQAVKSSKKALLVKASTDQGYTFNSILNTADNLDFTTPAETSQSSKLSVGSIRTKGFDKDDLLALLLDPEDVNALIESNIQPNTSSDDPHSTLLSTAHQSVLKLEDVLYKEDNLDEYLPAADTDKWYLFGDHQVIDKVISGPGMQDIHDALLMQQLMVENYVEK